MSYGSFFMRLTKVEGNEGFQLSGGKGIGGGRYTKESLCNLVEGLSLHILIQVDLF